MKLYTHNGGIGWSFADLYESGGALNLDLLCVDCKNVPQIRCQLSAVGVGTVTFQCCATPDFAVPVSLPALPISGGNPATTATATGAFIINPLLRYVRARLTAWTSGTFTMSTELLERPVFNENYNTNLAALPALPAGTSQIGDVGVVYRGNATGAATIKHIVSAATTNATNIKAAAGRIVGIKVANTTAAWKYLKLHNTAGAPTAGAGVYMAVAIPPNGRADIGLDGGIGFSTGIAYTIVAGSADTDATAVAAGDVVGAILYA